MNRLRSYWLSAALSMPLAAGAHHAGTAFENAKETSISGTVSQWLWTNPHTWIYLQVMTDHGAQEYHFEGMAVSILARNGWTSMSLKPGDQVTIAYAPYKDDGRLGGEYRTVTFPDGHTLTWSGL